MDSVGSRSVSKPLIGTDTYPLKKIRILMYTDTDMQQWILIWHLILQHVPVWYIAHNTVRYCTCYICISIQIGNQWFLLINQEEI